MRFMTHLSNRFILRLFPDYQDCEYIFLDLLGTPIKTAFELNYSSIAKLLMKSEYGVVTYEDGWLLLKRGLPQTKNGNVLKNLFKRCGILFYSLRQGEGIPESNSNFQIAYRVQGRKFKKSLKGYFLSGKHLVLPPGHYRAIFRLMTRREGHMGPLAILSVNGIKEQSITVIYEKWIHDQDFDESRRYKDFVIDVYTTRSNPSHPHHITPQRTLPFVRQQHGTQDRQRLGGLLRERTERYLPFQDEVPQRPLGRVVVAGDTRIQKTREVLGGALGHLPFDAGEFRRIGRLFGRKQCQSSGQLIIRRSRRKRRASCFNIRIDTRECAVCGDAVRVRLPGDLTRNGHVAQLAQDVREAELVRIVECAIRAVVVGDKDGG